MWSPILPIRFWGVFRPGNPVGGVARAMWAFAHVSSKLKTGESSKMELTHPKVVASSAETLRRCVKHIAEGGRSERDLRDERNGPFDPVHCPGTGRVPQHHADYSIDIKRYGIRGRWTCLHHKLETIDWPVARQTVEVANANFRRIDPRGHDGNSGRCSDQPAMPHCLHAWKAVSTATYFAHGTGIWIGRGFMDLKV